MLTSEDLKNHNISKYAIMRLFNELGYPITYPTLMSRFEDQNWLYAHGMILRQLGVWTEPDIIVNSRMMAELQKRKPGKKVDPDPDEAEVIEEVTKEVVDQDTEKLTITVNVKE